MFYWCPEWVFFMTHDSCDRGVICCDPQSDLFGAVVGFFHRDGPENNVLIPPGPRDGPARPLLRFIEMVVSHCEARFTWADREDGGHCFCHQSGDDDEQILLKTIKEMLQTERFDDPFPAWPFPVST